MMNSEITTISTLINRFSYVIDRESRHLLDNEWRLLRSSLDDINFQQNPKEF